MVFQASLLPSWMNERMMQMTREARMELIGMGMPPMSRTRRNHGENGRPSSRANCKEECQSLEVRA